MNTIGYTSSQVGSSTTSPYSRDYLGAVQLLDNSGFNPFVDTSPFNSTLYRIFNRFVERTGLDTNVNTLKDEYIEQNPSSREAVNLYNSLENTFAPRGTGEKAAIVDFLNKKIDEFVTRKDTDESGSLSREESGLTGTLFSTIDTNRDATISAEEMQNNFYNDFNQLNNVLNYFQNTPGALIDLFA